MPDGLVNQIRTNGQALFHLLQFDSFGADCFTGGPTEFPAELAGALEFVGGGAILDGRRVREVHPKRGKWTRAAARPRIGLSKTNSVRESAEGMRQ